MTSDLTLLALDLVWGFIAAGMFWVLGAVVFGWRRSPLISVGVVAVLTLGVSVLFDITQGLTHVLGVAWVATLNTSITAFTFGAMLAAVGILSMIVSAAVVLLTEALDG